MERFPLALARWLVVQTGVDAALALASYLRLGTCDLETSVKPWRAWKPNSVDVVNEL